ncbi:MAG TPA: polysaccharide biosynthesis tyrosine autokinase [Candidatus Polarisedimenticolia bacterium]|nr:polysaccharide biosynthesis tyrosine autokinase [Candidatus Polarisedimenticolia bacterium]
MSNNLPTPEEKRDVHLLDYWRTVVRGRWTVLSIFVVVVTLVAIGTFTQKPIYRARATVEITPQARKVAPVADVSELGSGNYGWFAEERYFNTQYEIIKSRDVAQRVFDKLDLYNHPLFKKNSDPVGAFASMVQVVPIKDTGIVEITLEGPSPQEVQIWVNAIADAYVDRNLDLSIEATTRAVKALLSEVAPLREKLQNTQRSSFELAEKDNLYVPENQQKITNDRLSTLQADFTDTQVKRSEIESVLKRIDEIRQSGGSFETIPVISADAVVRDLYREKAGLERDLEKLLVTYREKHVKVLEKQSEIDKTSQKMASEIDRIISGLRTDYALLKDRETKLAAAIDSTRSESLRVNEKATTFELMRSEAVDTRRIYDLISARVKEIDLSASLLNNNLRVLDEAPLPKAPVKPRPVLNMAIGIILGLLLGVGTVFFLDYMDNTVRTSEDVERYLKLNILAIVPRDSDETRRAVREAYQTLRTSLLFSRKSRAANAVLVTSAGPQEGKTCTTVNLGRTLANAGEKVVIIDCDLRRPTVHQWLKLGRDHGITNYILSTEGDDWRNYIKATEVPNLHALTSGPIPPNPADVFGQERFKRLLKELREEFDWVFIDSPPAVSLADATILASLCDMVTFVVKHNENDKDLIRRCVSDLRKVNPNVIGGVLNSIDVHRSDFKDYYYVGYYYYGETSASRKSKKSRSSPALGTEEPGAAEKITRIVG